MHPALGGQLAGAFYVNRPPDAARLAWREMDLVADLVHTLAKISIQPKQRAASTASGQVMLARPELRL
jgi:hypothetical protein